MIKPENLNDADYFKRFLKKNIYFLVMYILYVKILYTVFPVNKLALAVRKQFFENIDMLDGVIVIS